APLNTWYKPAEMDYAIAHSETRVVVSVDRFLGRSYADDLYALIPELREAEPGRLRSQRYPHLGAVAFIGGEHPGALGYRDLDQLAEGVGERDLKAAAA